MNEPLTAFPAILGPPLDPEPETAASLRSLLESYQRGVEQAEKRLAAERDPGERKLIATGLELTREHRDGIAARLRAVEQEEKRNMAKKKADKKKPKRTQKPEAPEPQESKAQETPPSDDETPPEEPKIDHRGRGVGPPRSPVLRRLGARDPRPVPERRGAALREAAVSPGIAEGSDHRARRVPRGPAHPRVPQNRR